MPSQFDHSRQQLSSRPLVSIILPVYNGERYLRESVESILTQTLSDYELVIIDDGSTDGTAALLDSFHDPRIIRLFNVTNVGLIDTLNRALKIVRGEFIARVDADDISLPDRLEQQVCFLTNHPELSLVGSRLEVIDGVGNVIHSVTDSRPTSPGVVHWRMFFDCVVSHPTLVARKEVFEALGGYRHGFEHAEDYDLLLRASFIARMANLPTVLCKVRTHNAQVSEIHSKEQNLNSDRAVQKALTTILGREVPYEATRALRNWHYVADVRQAFEIAKLLRELYHVYTNSSKLSDPDRIEISTDAAWRAAELAIICTKADPWLALKLWEILIEFHPAYLERILVFVIKRAFRYIIKSSSKQNGVANS